MTPLRDAREVKNPGGNFLSSIGGPFPKVKRERKNVKKCQELSIMGRCLLMLAKMQFFLWDRTHSTGG